MKLMQKDPKDRYQSGYGIRMDLEECQRRLKECEVNMNFGHFSSPILLYFNCRTWKE
jgi:hypothetical protein